MIKNQIIAESEAIFYYPEVVCGRYIVSQPKSVLRDLLERAPDTEYRPRFNVAPGQLVPIIVRDQTLSSQLREMQWGFKSHLRQGAKSAIGNINARAETVSEKPTFRNSFRFRRCIVPADGFYEWQSTSAGRQPYLLQLNDRAAFGFAGLWNQSRNNTGELVHTFTILTTRANTLLSDLHARMPVILDARDRESWLNAGLAHLPSKGFYEPYPSSGMTMTPVSKAVNNAHNDSIDCLQAIALNDTSRLFAL